MADTVAKVVEGRSVSAVYVPRGPAGAAYAAVAAAESAAGDATNAATDAQAAQAAAEAAAASMNLDGVAKAPDAVGKVHRKLAGVIRQTAVGAGWEFIADAGHASVGFDPTVSIVGGDLQIDFGFSAAKVLTFSVTPDETFAGSGLVAGASVGLSSATISLYAPLEFRTSGTAVAAGNFLEAGVDFTTTFDVAAGTLTVTHPPIVHADSQGGFTSVLPQGAPDGNQFACVASSTKTGYVVNYLHPIAGRVNGAAVTSLNVGSSAVWNGTDTLTITHPTSGVSVNDVAVAPEAAGNIPVVTGSTATTITVQFRDYAGTLLTGAASPGVFRYMRGGLAKSTISGSSKLWHRRGLVKVRPERVANSSGNLWLYAEMEI